MALFLGIHNMGDGVTDEVVLQSWEAYKTACESLGCSAKHAHANARQGRAFCITEATSANLVQQAHDEAKVPVNEIIEVVDL